MHVQTYSHPHTLQAYEEALVQDPEGVTDIGFYESKKEQYSRKNYLLAIPKLTAPDLVFVTRPNTGLSHFEMDIVDLRNNYRKLKDPQDAKLGWDSIYDQTEDSCIHGVHCKVQGCTQGGRKQTVKIVTGAVVPIFNAMEATIMRHRLVSKVLLHRTERTFVSSLSYKRLLLDQCYRKSLVRKLNFVLFESLYQSMIVNKKRDLLALGSRMLIIS